MNVMHRTPSGHKPLTLYGTEFTSRLLLGTARYPSPQSMSDAVKASRAGIVTVSVRREQARGGGVEVRGQLGDLVAEAVQLRGGMDLHGEPSFD